eukprot:PLAT1200.1.p1 GENE.PLAT1200.1~~PLAT1200.1.p1  ORF type:complete len:412 (-),score=203.17 PLAT1200.1:67-1302(-)
MLRPLSRRLLTTTARMAAPELREAVIVATARTPIGSMGGALASESAPKLGSAVIRGVLDRAGVAGEDVEEAYIGNVCSAAIGQAPARQAVLGADLPLSVPCTTVHKVCASGMKATMLAASGIMIGARDVVLAGGMESMSNIPYYLPAARNGLRFGHGEVVDGMIFDGLWDVYNDQHMGMCGEKCAEDYAISREEQDAFALESYARAVAATEAGHFDSEILPYTVKSRRGETVISADEEPSKLRADKVPSLRPAFKRDGSVTAANASKINDGASMLLLMSAEAAAARGVTPLARIIGFGDAARDPVDFTTAPSLAVPEALKAAGLTLSDVDYHEINEAFAVVALANMKLMGLDADKVNVFGGAVALGHPIGSSGSRIISTLLNVLQKKDATVGCASICNGGGGASAILIERL